MIYQPSGSAFCIWFVRQIQSKHGRQPPSVIWFDWLDIGTSRKRKSLKTLPQVALGESKFRHRYIGNADPLFVIREGETSRSISHHHGADFIWGKYQTLPSRVQKSARCNLGQWTDVFIFTALWSCPSRFQVPCNMTSISSPTPLVSVQDVTACIALMRCIHKLQGDIQLSGKKPPTPDALKFLRHAVIRFGVWLSTRPNSHDLSALDQTPPIDVLMVWHTYMLVPITYWIDSQSLSILESLGGMPWKILVNLTPLFNFVA